MASSSSVGIPTASGGGGTGYGGGSGRIDSLSSPPPLYMADQHNQHSYQHHLQSTAVNRQKVITDSTDELANRFRYTNFQSSLITMSKKIS